MPVLPSTETSQLICCANQLTGFYMRARLVLHGLTALHYYYLPCLYMRGTLIATGLTGHY